MDLLAQCNTLFRETETFKNDHTDLWTDLSSTSRSEFQSFQDKLLTIQEEIESPARIGLVGQVSAGKTRMLEVFLGNVGGTLSATGVGAGATTGNIVEFNISAGNDEQTTFDSWKIQIMSEQHVNSLFEEFIKEVERKAVSGDVQHDTLRQKLKTIKANSNQMSRTDYWAELNKWSIDAYNQDNIRTISPVALEMYRLSQCLTVSGKKWLGKTLDADENQASWVMTLENGSVVPNTLASRHLSFPELGTDFKTIEEKIIRQFFPIVQKIKV
ncbi:MAG: hypothetical protein Q4F84_08000, partial [Fibrobacter sp.]|nr:hypothetical protein [Fibrobacter sp.]